MEALEQELIDKGYWIVTADNNISTTAKFSEMMMTFFDEYGFNICVTESMIENYIMELE